MKSVYILSGCPTGAQKRHIRLLAVELFIKKACLSAQQRWNRPFHLPMVFYNHHTHILFFYSLTIP